MHLFDLCIHAIIFFHLSLSGEKWFGIPGAKRNALNISTPMNLYIPSQNKNTLRLGFVPLCDAAPFLLAQEMDLFSKHGVDVCLSRELGWASIRDKMATGELLAAQAIAGLPFAAKPQHKRFIAPLVTSLQGNAITISKEYRHEIDQAPRAILKNHKSRKLSRLPTFAIVSRYSSHHMLMRSWLRSGGINPDTETNLVVLPPTQMVYHLKAGHIDGYCAGEPWNSVGIMSGCGFCVATSAELSPYHPEKVLMMSESFWKEDQERSERLMTAIIEACQMCGDDTHLEYISSVLSRHDYLNLSPEILFNALKGHILRKNNPSLDASREFIFFSGDEVNSPSQRKRSWIQQGLVESGVLQQKISTEKNIFREDIYQQVTCSKETASADR